MGDKSTQKKQYIIEKAKEVFAKRGYKDVTMKDIVDACGISQWRAVPVFWQYKRSVRGSIGTADTEYKE